MPQSLDIQLQNQTNSNRVWAYITGRHKGSLVLLQANGRDVYFPQSPSAILQPLQADCAIPLGPPGSAVTVHIPQMDGGRLWFSAETPLTFLLNPGPALVEPSVLNPSDPNAAVDFSFAEFTLNNDQLFANISYVDFVPRLPIALTLQDSRGGVQHVSGMAADGLARVVAGLRDQAARDGRPWDKLAVQPAGQSAPLRVLNPTHGDAVGADFSGYFDPLVQQTWRRYGPAGGATMRIDTQAGAGIVDGSVNDNGELVFQGEAFTRPNTADIFGCNSGPFTTGPSPLRNAIIPRLAAAFQRSTLIDVEFQPSDPSTFYLRNPTNHYSRIVHECNLDGKGYAFAYDDVQPSGGADQSGKTNAGDPALFIVAVGGNNAYAGDRLP